MTTANPFATRAALRMLDRGGSAADAAIAAQMVLGLVEAQSSGIGGGSLVMHWDAGARKLESYDGLAAAPGRVTAALTVDVDGSAIPPSQVQRGGRSVGVPGTLAVLRMVHEKHGKLAWAELFEPAIELAEQGFPMQPYMHNILATPTAADDHPDMLTVYFDAARKVLPVGATVRNPDYAATMRRIARLGPAGLWAEGHGARLLESMRRGRYPSSITEADLASYWARQREPLCGPFLVYSVCVMAPPSFGGVVVLQVLQMLQHRAAATATAATRFDFDDPAFVHFYAEAGKLAQADRTYYIGDPGFATMPLRALVSPSYLKTRAGLIDPARAMTDAAFGREVADATSQLAVVDRQGNALSMTTTINLNFGSRIMVDGFVLNNAMTNFATSPTSRAGEASPNRMQAGKRPVTSMAPVVVFDARGRVVALGGSAGGGQIVDYIAQSLVEMLANERSPAQAIARGHVSTAVRGKLQLERASGAAALAPALRALGHDVDIATLPSGLGFLMRRGDGWIGAADPRRDGIALGR